MIFEVISKVELYIRYKFENIINGILFVMSYMKKYCFSFSGISGDVYLEIVMNYEKQC